MDSTTLASFFIRGVSVSLVPDNAKTHQCQAFPHPRHRSCRNVESTPIRNNNVRRWESLGSKDTSLATNVRKQKRTKSYSCQKDDAQQGNLRVKRHASCLPLRLPSLQTHRLSPFEGCQSRWESISSPTPSNSKNRKLSLKKALRSQNRESKTLKRIISDSADMADAPPRLPSRCLVLDDLTCGALSDSISPPNDRVDPFKDFVSTDSQKKSKELPNIPSRSTSYNDGENHNNYRCNNDQRSRIDENSAAGPFLSPKAPTRLVSSSTSHAINDVTEDMKDDQEVILTDTNLKCLAPTTKHRRDIIDDAFDSSSSSFDIDQLSNITAETEPESFSTLSSSQSQEWSFNILSNLNQSRLQKERQRQEDIRLMSRLESLFDASDSSLDTFRLEDTTTQIDPENFRMPDQSECPSMGSSILNVNHFREVQRVEENDATKMNKYPPDALSGAVHRIQISQRNGQKKRKLSGKYSYNVPLGSTELHIDTLNYAFDCLEDTLKKQEQKMNEFFCLLTTEQKNDITPWLASFFMTKEITSWMNDTLEGLEESLTIPAEEVSNYVLQSAHDDMPSVVPWCTCW